MYQVSPGFPATDDANHRAREGRTDESRDSITWQWQHSKCQNLPCASKNRNQCIHLKPGMRLFQDPRFPILLHARALARHRYYTCTSTGGIPLIQRLDLDGLPATCIHMPTPVTGPQPLCLVATRSDWRITHRDPMPVCIQRGGGGVCLQDCRLQALAEWPL